MGTERGGKDTARASRDNDHGACTVSGCMRPPIKVCHDRRIYCAEHACRHCRPRESAPCPSCEVLRGLLRLALGKLRDVQRADVTGTVNVIELALDGAMKGAANNGE